MDQRGARPAAAQPSSSTCTPNAHEARTSRDAWERIGQQQRVRSAQREATAARDRGVVHTPPPVAALMARRLLHGVGRGTRLRVLDPGCGGAQLLCAVVQEAARRGVRVACEGVELDATTARWAHGLGRRVAGASKTGLESWRVRQGDYLVQPRRRSSFGAVIANPPWVPMRDVPAAYRASLRARFDLPARTDLAVLFVERMLEDLVVGGRLCVIVPNKLLAAEYAAALRQRLFNGLHVTEVWDLSAAAPFRGRATYPVVVVARRNEPSARAMMSVRAADGGLRAIWRQRAIAKLPRNIVPLQLPAQAAPMLEHLFRGTRFGDHVHVSCGIATTGFARGIGSGSDRIVCCADVQAFRVDSSRPFDPAAVGIDAARLERMRVAKIVVPGMFRRLHAAFDAHGQLLGRVYYVPVPVPAKAAAGVDADGQRTLLLALLNSRLYSVLYRGLFDAVAQSGGWLRLNAPYLNCMPWPRRKPPAALTTLVRDLEETDSAARRERLDTLVESLFELGDSQRALLKSLDAAWLAGARPRNRRAASRTGA